jgi:hypothetical protein
MLAFKRRSLKEVCVLLVNDQCVVVKTSLGCWRFVAGGIPWFVEFLVYLKAEGSPPFVVRKPVPYISIYQSLDRGTGKITKSPSLA